MTARWQSRLNHLLFFCVIVFMLGGCATIKPPALSSDTNKIDVAKESIALLTVKIANEYKTSYQPNIKYVFVWSNGEKDREKYSFKVGEKYNEAENSFNEYLVSFQLPAGSYKLRELFAQSGIFPVIGSFAVPVYSSFSIAPNKIIYLGHLEAIIKERTDDKELRAGSVFPLIDQAVTGASGGTFVVTITDLFEDDIKLFQKKYPYLTQYQVDNLTLPQWTQPTEKDMQ
ncbi:MAG TPA: hypothetical protein VKA34_15475 [Balneolales bacterium]|nr:hypothetical protein [Balneolales bacterium]